MYNARRYSSSAGDFLQTTPVTKIIIGIWVVSFISDMTSFHLNTYLRFAGNLPNCILGLITFSLVITDTSVLDPFITLLFAGLLLYQFGGSLERSWGTKKYLLFLLGACLSSSIVWLAGCVLLTHMLPALATPWYLVSAVMVAWAWINAEETVLAWFVLPMQAKWIAWLTIALLYFSSIPKEHGAIGVVLGFFSLGGILFAYGMHWYQQHWAWIPRRRDTRNTPLLQHPSSGLFASLLRPYRDWQRRRRIAKLQRTFKLDD